MQWRVRNRRAAQTFKMTSAHSRRLFFILNLLANLGQRPLWHQTFSRALVLAGLMPASWRYSLQLLFVPIPNSSILKREMQSTVRRLYQSLSQGIIPRRINGTCRLHHRLVPLVHQRPTVVRRLGLRPPDLGRVSPAIPRNREAPRTPVCRRT